jgi:hypothetical protein
MTPKFARGCHPCWATIANTGEAAHNGRERGTA